MNGERTYKPPSNAYALPEWAEELKGHLEDVGDRLGVSVNTVGRLRIVAASGNQKLYNAVRGGRVPAMTAVKAVKEGGSYEEQMQRVGHLSKRKQVSPANGRGPNVRIWQDVATKLEASDNIIYGILQQYGPGARNSMFLDNLTTEQKQELAGHLSRLRSRVRQLVSFLEGKGVN